MAQNTLLPQKAVSCAIPWAAMVAAMLPFASRVAANDLVVTVSGTSLTIEGDADANTLSITGGLGVCDVQLDGGTTTINGIPGPLVVSGITQIAINLNAGNDNLEISDLVFCASGFTSLNVDGGLGDDEVRMSGTSILDTDSETDIQVTIVGDDNVAYSGSCGDDTIIVEDTFLSTLGGNSSNSLMNLYGEVNDYSDVTGGNDTIRISGTTLHTTGSATACSPKVVPYVTRVSAAR